jgi:hypothetical protein
MYWKDYFILGLAIILVLVYASIMGFVIMKVIQCGNDPQCTVLTEKDVRGDLLLFANVIGGLISGIVIMVFAIKKKGEALRFVLIAKDTEEKIKNVEKTVATIFCFTWAVVGVAAFFVGVILFPGVSETLYTVGKEFIGLAIAAIYALFGIYPEQQTARGA